MKQQNRFNKGEKNSRDGRRDCISCLMVKRDEVISAVEFK